MSSTPPGISRRAAMQGGAALLGLAAVSACGDAPVGQISAHPDERRSGPIAPFGDPSPEQPSPGKEITAVRGSRSSNWLEQTRSEVLARRGVVATSQPLASQAGLQILQEGGTSADAAVAAAATLGVVEPESAGIGGDSFAIHYDAKTRKLYALNSAGWSAKAWNLEYFRTRGFVDGMPHTGIHSVSVPGAVEGWAQLLDRFGKKDFSAALEPAAQIAEQGFGVTEFIHSQWAHEEELLAEDVDSTATFLRNGRAPGLYTVFANPDLARAYRTLQHGGRDAFYTGDIAKALIGKSHKLGGALTMADLAEFRAEWVEPLTTEYGGFTVHQLPPPNQGFATLLILNIVGAAPEVLGKDLAQLGPRDPLFWHIMVEAKKLAYSELHRYNADPRFRPPPLDHLLSADFARELCHKIDTGKAKAPEVRGTNPGGTVYLATADRWGNMTSFVYSIYSGFGSGITVPGYGFPLQNRASGFSLSPDSPNVVAARKRPFHTLLAGFVTREQRPVLAFGNMGGDIQAQAQALELVNMITLGYNPQAATDAARFRHDQWSDELILEAELAALVGKQLSAWGHKLAAPSSATMGGYQAVAYQPEHPGDWPSSLGDDGPLNGVWRAASDHRKDGLAAGW